MTVADYIATGDVTGILVLVVILLLIVFLIRRL